MFCVELRLQGKKSFSMILFFIISFLDFDKNIHIHTKKFVLHLIYMYVVSIYSKYTAEKKVSRVMGGDSSTSDYLNIFSRVHIVFLTMPSFSWWTSAQSQICSEDTVQNFEIVFLNIDHTGIQCHVSLFNYYTGTHVVNNYNGSQCHVSSYKGPSSSIMAFLLALMMARTLSLMYCK